MCIRCPMVDARSGSKADICSVKRHVRFTPESNLWLCPTLSRHIPIPGVVAQTSLYIHPSVQFADVHSGMFFESRCDAFFDALTARWPPYLFALRLRFAGNGRPFVAIF